MSWSPVTLTIPLPSGAVAYLADVRTMTESQWNSMLSVLAAMRPGIVSNEPPVRLCHNGHPQTPENVYGKAGGKRCRICNRDNQLRFDQLKYGHRRPHRGIRP